MPNRRLISLTLCLLMLASLLAGCSIVQEPAAAPGTPAVSAAETAPTPTEEPGEAPAAEGETAPESGSEATPEPTPEPAPEPTPGQIQLSAGSFPPDSRELTAVVTAEDLPLLESFTELRQADFRGSACQQELVDWAIRHPEVSVRCDVTLSDGTKLDADTKELSLPDTVPGEDLLTLVLLPDLRSVELGACEDAAESPLDWEALARAEAACPQAEFHYAFRLYHKEFDLQSTEMDLNHITMDDEGALVKKVAACLPDLALLDMDFCEVSDEAMAGIRDSLPETEVIWRIWFGKGRQGGYTARTNAIKILDPGLQPGLGRGTDAGEYRVPAILHQGEIPGPGPQQPAHGYLLRPQHAGSGGGDPGHERRQGSEAPGGLPEAGVPGDPDLRDQRSASPGHLQESAASEHRIQLHRDGHHPPLRTDGSGAALDRRSGPGTPGTGRGDAASGAQLPDRFGIPRPHWRRLALYQL